MIAVSYRIDTRSLAQVKKVDLTQASSGQLHYDYFLGDIILRIGGKDLSTNWGWVPVLDFAICMMSIIEGLGNHQSETFEFTESDAMIKLAREDNTILITANYTGNVSELVEVDYESFKNAIHMLLTEILEYLIQEIPILRRNSYIQTIIKKYDLQLTSNKED